MSFALSHFVKTNSIAKYLTTKVSVDFSSPDPPQKVS